MKKVIVITICFLLSGFILALAALYWLQVFSPHPRRIAAATKTMAKFTVADWRQLYVDCGALHDTMGRSNIAVPAEAWTPQVIQLNPYYVYLTDDRVFMTWTGGFDDFLLWLFVLLDDAPVPVSGEVRSAGIWLCDSRKTGPVEKAVYIAENRGQPAVGP